MDRQILIRNIAYMERELLQMKKELAELDAKVEQQEGTSFTSCTEMTQTYCHF